jgi:predicted nucleic acid-binding protein
VRLVVDASVALKWFFRDRVDEPDAEAAADILQGYSTGRHELLAPPHFIAEMCAVLAREAPGTVDTDLRDLLELAIPTRDDALIYARAMHLSRDLGQHLFDTLYHAVALETEGAVLVTADQKYLKAAQATGRIRSLQEWIAER